MAERTEKPGGGKTASGKKAIAIGALGLALIAGAAYKYLSQPVKNDEDVSQAQNRGVQKQDDPVVPPDQNSPVTPSDQSKPGSPHRTLRPPADASDTSPSSVHSATDTMTARLLSPIDTRNANQGDTFTAKLEDGPYQGGILTGTIRKLKKSRKNIDLELEFNKLDGKLIPVGLDLVDISNAHGVKGVDDENNKITGNSSKKKVPIVTAGTTALGTVIEAVKGGKKGSAGYLVSMKVMTRSPDVDLQPGSRITLRETGR